MTRSVMCAGADRRLRSNGPDATLADPGAAEATVGSTASLTAGDVLAPGSAAGRSRSSVTPTNGIATVTGAPCVAAGTRIARGGTAALHRVGPWNVQCDGHPARNAARP